MSGAAWLKTAIPSCMGLVAAIVVIAKLESAAGVFVLGPELTDIGVVIQGDPVQVSFTVANPGRGPCSVISVVPSCACAGVHGLPTELPAGSHFEARLDVDTRDKVGPLEANVLIVHNGRGDPMRRVGVRGHVRRALNTTPRAWIVHDPSRAVREVAPTLDVVLRSPAGVDLSTLRFVEPLGLVKCDWMPVEGASGGRRCRLRMVAPLPAGEFSLRAEFKTPTFTQMFRIKASLGGLVTAGRPEVNLALAPDGSGQQALPLTTREGEIASVTIERAGAPLRVQSQRDAKGAWTLDVRRMPTRRTVRGSRVIVVRVEHRDAPGSPTTTQRLVVRVHWDTLGSYTAGTGKP